MVLPIVIYTGERPWRAPTRFRDLVTGGDLFAAFIPEIEPIFLSLPSESEQDLVRDGGALGTVLHVLQQRHADLDAFHAIYLKAARTIQEEAARNDHRLRELLAYLEALVYHFRKGTRTGRSHWRFGAFHSKTGD